MGNSGSTMDRAPHHREVRAAQHTAREAEDSENCGVHACVLVCARGRTCVSAWVHMHMCVLAHVRACTCGYEESWMGWVITARDWESSLKAARATRAGAMSRFWKKTELLFVQIHWGGGGNEYAEQCPTRRHWTGGLEDVATAWKLQRKLLTAILTLKS